MSNREQKNYEAEIKKLTKDFKENTLHKISEADHNGKSDVKNLDAGFQLNMQPKRTSLKALFLQYYAYLMQGIDFRSNQNSGKEDLTTYNPVESTNDSQYMQIPQEQRNLQSPNYFTAKNEDYILSTKNEGEKLFFEAFNEIQRKTEKKLGMSLDEILVNGITRNGLNLRNTTLFKAKGNLMYSVDIKDGESIYERLMSSYMTMYQNLADAHKLVQNQKRLAEPDYSKISDSLCEIIKIEHAMASNIDSDSDNFKKINQSIDSLETKDYFTTLQAMREHIVQFCDLLPTVFEHNNIKTAYLINLFEDKSSEIKDIVQKNFDTSEAILNEDRTFSTSNIGEFKSFCKSQRIQFKNDDFSNKFNQIFNLLKSNYAPKDIHRVIHDKVFLTKTFSEDFNHSGTANSFERNPKGGWSTIKKLTTDVIEESMQMVEKIFNDAGFDVEYIADKSILSQKNTTNALITDQSFEDTKAPIWGDYDKNTGQIRYDADLFNNNKNERLEVHMFGTILHENLHRFFQHPRDYENNNTDYNQNLTFSYLNLTKIESIKTAVKDYLEGKGSFDDAIQSVVFSIATLPYEFDIAQNSVMSYNRNIEEKEPTFHNIDRAVLNAFGVLYNEVKNMQKELEKINSEEQYMTKKYTQCKSDNSMYYIIGGVVGAFLLCGVGAYLGLKKRKSQSVAPLGNVELADINSINNNNIENLNQHSEQQPIQESGNNIVDHNEIDIIVNNQEYHQTEPSNSLLNTNNIERLHTA